MKKNRTLVIGDIHGAAKALDQCLKRCNFDYEYDTLIVLGDIVDGWPDVFNTVETLLKIKNLIVIMGNHDEWFIDYIKTGIHPINWKMGGEGTAYSYLKEIGKEQMILKKFSGLLIALNPADIPEKHQNLFTSMIPWYEKRTEKQHYCFVHGGFDRDYGIAYQHKSVLMWDRNLWQHAQICNKEKLETIDGFSKIFIGHTAINNRKNPKVLPLYCSGVWNLDTGAGWSGKLTIMDIETEHFWQSDFVTDLYPEETIRRT
jgi:serine/threonine protein phosphatase 1